MICPMCKNPVDNLVKRYDVINTKTGKGEGIELEKSVCELCVYEIYLDIKERANKTN